MPLAEMVWRASLVPVGMGRGNTKSFPGDHPRERSLIRDSTNGAAIGTLPVLLDTVINQNVINYDKIITS